MIYIIIYKHTLETKNGYLYDCRWSDDAERTTVQCPLAVPDHLRHADDDTYLVTVRHQPEAG